jgi:hypothetical protein
MKDQAKGSRDYDDEALSILRGVADQGEQLSEIFAECKTQLGREPIDADPTLRRIAQVLCGLKALLEPKVGPPRPPKSKSEPEQEEPGP